MMNQDLEMLDVFTDDNEKKIGIASRGVVHQCNLWHREVACWIINEKGEILLQRRSPNKKQHPNMLAVTAGHIDIDETPIKAVVREVAEEVGINDVSEKEFVYLDTFKVESINNHHYKYVYWLKIDKKIQDLKMQESEVCELFFVSLEKLRNMMAEPNSEITFAKQFYIPIILDKIEKVIHSKDSQ